METALVIGAVVVSFGAWGFMFLLPRDDIWPRTWAAAAVLTGYAIAALAALDRLDRTVGPVDLTELGIGVGVGSVWLVATHVGHAILCRLFPAFIEQIRDLYRLGDGDRIGRMVGPIVAMGIAEEFLFRGVIQGRAGLAAGVLAYTAVQVVERKWALGLAALLGGLVWGTLFWWRAGLVAPIAAHVLWTGSLTFVWPLRGCGRRRIETPVDRAMADH